MADKTPSGAYTKYQSDVIVDLMQNYDFEYVSINPGASFRGLHDSLINYGNDNPKMLVCQHEETAVQIAHGYTRATGRPMATILHDVVGLLHGQMAIYYAFIDRAPVFVIGATGPMDESMRRPRSDWIHTALVQGEAVRNFTKYDYQPYGIEGVVDSFMRAYSAMVTEPQGPIYMCYDAMLQETPLTQDIPLPPANMARAPSPMAADPAVLANIVDRLLAAERPWIMTEFSGRQPGNFDKLIELAEVLGVAVWDVNRALCFPNRHPLNLSMDTDSLSEADAILALDVVEWEKATAKLDSTTREVSSALHPRLHMDGCGIPRDRHRVVVAGSRSLFAQNSQRARRSTPGDAANGRDCTRQAQLEPGIEDQGPTEIGEIRATPSSAICRLVARGRHTSRRFAGHSPEACRRGVAGHRW